MLNALQERYLTLMETPHLKSFQASGGRLFIATEKQSAETIAALYSAGHRLRLYPYSASTDLRNTMPPI